MADNKAHNKHLFGKNEVGVHNIQCSNMCCWINNHLKEKHNIILQI